MRLSEIKKLRRDICKVVDHNFEEGGFRCTRCKCRINGWTFVGKIPVRKDVEVLPAKDSIVWDFESQSLVMWDGTNWRELGKS